MLRYGQVAYPVYLGTWRLTKMADRKQFLGDAKIDPELMKLLDVVRERGVTEEELHEQRISFAYGNAPETSKITKDSVRRASRNIRLRS